MNRSRVRRRTAITGLIAAILVGGCTVSLRTGADLYPAYSLDRYTSFTFDEIDLFPSGGPRIDDNPLFEQRLHAAIEWELATRGIRMSGGGPPLTVHHHVNVRDVVDVIEVDREAGFESDRAEEWETIEYREATFVIGIADAESRQIVWRGWAHLSAEGDLDDPDWMRSRIDDAVAKMFERFPLARRQ